MKRTFLLGSVLLGSLFLITSLLSAQKFYPDDPLEKEPPPFPVEAANLRTLNAVYEIFQNVFKTTSQRLDTPGAISAQNVNTLGEVMDGAWFVNRHANERTSVEMLQQGPGTSHAPMRSAQWRVLTIQKYGVRPGLLIADPSNTTYLLQFDPPGHAELSTGAAMVSSRLLYALGYWVPEFHIVYFQRSDLKAGAGGQGINAVGGQQKLIEEDIDLFLERVEKDQVRGYRAVALRAPPGVQLAGPFQFFGRRSDDPNDLVPHEHRRELRGLHVISSWINNNSISAMQTMDGVVTEGGTPHFRHYLIDFTSTLGSGTRQEKHAREGNEPLFEIRSLAKNFLGLGFYAPKWQRADYPDLPSVGKLESAAFEPAKWQPDYAVTALANRLPDDDYWAAKKILSFTDDDLRAIAKTGEYSDPRAAEWIANALIGRRDKIGRYYLDRVLPLDNFRLDAGELRFDDLAALHGFRPGLKLSVEWSQFNNLTLERQPIYTRSAFEIPERALAAGKGSYFAAKISGPEKDNTVTVYLRSDEGGLKIAGIDRDWPGKRTESGPNPASSPRLQSHYKALFPEQRDLFIRYTQQYVEKTGIKVKPEDFYEAQSLSERTTFEAVTHALLRSKLTDAEGNSLGTALDRVTGIERIAGQYYGRQGDEQFRLYCYLKPDTREVLEKSQEFHFGHENTVYHPGYPQSYRQAGAVPNMQFSISQDGLKADVDVDYRSSKMPQVFWNGHLSSANSDVRVGDNYKRHVNRWAGLVNWWQAVFGKLPTAQGEPVEMLAKQASPPPTPLPPNRSANAPIAEVQDAVQEFLSDWLVRRNYDEAMAFVSQDALACVALDDGSRPESLTPAQARSQLRVTMEAISKRLGAYDNLTEIVEALIPWRKAFRLVQQPFSREFALVQTSDAYAKAFACQLRSDENLTRALDEPNPQYGNYYGAVFRLRLGSDQGGALGVLWSKENRNWRIKAWQTLE